ncbi:MAG TPA: MFS transporter [Gemmatimonadaceae bacterium]|jgi:ACS family tartrate transporter-like MFS transporter
MRVAQSPVPEVARSALAKASWHILPLLVLAYICALMDRVNIGFAALQMNVDLGFSATVYGLGGGLFFLGYALFEVPSNVLLARFGARRWIARIMITWGLLGTSMMFVGTPTQFYVVRFLLGVAEAGFFPGVVYYLSQWYPRSHRGRAFSIFYAAVPLSSIVMGSLAGVLLGLSGHSHLKGWQWLFLVEGLPAVVMGVVILGWLPDTPTSARWLSEAESGWMEGQLALEAAAIGEPVSHNVVSALRHPLVLQFSLIGFLVLFCSITFTLSAPLVLKELTTLSAAEVGYLVGFGGILAAIGTLFSGRFSDKRGDRFGPILTGTTLMGGAFLGMAFAPSASIVILAYFVFAAAWPSVASSLTMLWPEAIHIRLLAVGAAAINSVANLGSFIGPYFWGVTRDASGSYHTGLLSLAAIAFVTLVPMLLLRRQVNTVTIKPAYAVA